MKKILLTGFALFFILVSLNLISAGLCRGNDGYYHDCEEHYYRNGERVYDNEFYYDKEKYIVYYDYRNNFRKGYDRNRRVIYDGNYRMDYNMDYRRSYEQNYLRGYENGYYDGYDYGYYSRDKEYRKGYDYYRAYDSRLDYRDDVFYFYVKG